MKSRFDIPVLFVFYKRKNTAVRVVRVISKIKPKKLYISQDGPRNEDEKHKVLEARKAVLSEINWDCELITWFHKKNIGLTNHAPGAFRKVFEKEEHLIYLEDDTLPNEDFFYFQRNMLLKFKNDKRIFSINGSNLFPGKTSQKESYFLSKICSVWGMGFWKRSWLLYKSILDSEVIPHISKETKRYFFNSKSYYQFCSYLKAIGKGFDNWDVLFNYTAIKNDMYFLTPSKNLIKNIGINVDSSSPFLGSYDKGLDQLSTIIHPGELVYHKDTDIEYFDKLMQGGWFRLLGVRLYLISPEWMKKFIELFTIKFIKRYY